MKKDEIITKAFQKILNESGHKPRRLYSTGYMTNLYPFIQGSLEWPFMELFSANL